MEHQDGSIYFPPFEERLNILTHGLGLLLSIIALFALVIHANTNGGIVHKISFSVFGSSLILTYAASTFFHLAKDPKIRRRFNIFDHSSIYVLIAGTYTPLTLITLEGRIGWTIFAIVWTMAGIGILFKLYYCGRYKLISTLSYVIMGLIIFTAINPLMHNLPYYGLIWLIGGSIAYIIGVVLYSSRKIKLNHAMFHVFVLIGSFCHFMVIYNYVS